MTVGRLTEDARGKAVLPGDDPVVSYCIPVMNRLADIQATLGENLRANAAFEGQVEFLLAVFNADQAVLDWVQAQFAGEISRGYLRILSDVTLESWHFGKAKNAFRPYVRGAVTSSLDGDNFVTADETRQLLELAAAQGNFFILHHFAGAWGDGTCGRVSLPTAVYRAVGYEPRLAPRQNDEFALILRALQRFPALPYCYQGPNGNALQKLNSARETCVLANIHNPMREIAVPLRRMPLNQRGRDYVDNARVLRPFETLNVGLMRLWGLGNAQSDAESRRKVVWASLDIAHLTPPADLPGLVFNGAKRRPRAGGVTLFCVQPEGGAISQQFVDHHLGLGVARVVIVRDDRAVEQPLPAGVVALDAKIGCARTTDLLWLQAAMAAEISAGDWALTLQANQLFRLPAGVADMAALVQQLQAMGADYAPALAVQMQQDAAGAWRPCVNEAPAPEGYLQNPVVVEQFGVHGRLSWRFDTRFAQAGAVAAVRRTPLLRFGRGLWLAPHFQTLRCADESRRPGPDVWASHPISHVEVYARSAKPPTRGAGR